jgi:predicted phosphodiesterase
MQNKAYYRFIVALLMISPLFTGCYSYIAEHGPSICGNPERNCFEDLIKHSQAQPDGHLNFRLAEDSELRVRVENFNSRDRTDELATYKREALTAPLLMRFVWLSDVHIRQRELRWGSKLFSEYLKKSVPSAEFNEAQADFHWAVYFSQIEAINQLNRDYRYRPVDFMIHTGDSVDTGSIEELYQFIYISNKLKIPWLNIVGNHDVTIFGNYMARLGYGRDPGVTFFPVGNLGDFIWMHRDRGEISGSARNLLPLPANSNHEPSVSTWKDKKLARTFHHGFDLEVGKTCTDKAPKIPSYDNAGNYATDLCAIPLPVRLIGLNSAKKDKLGAEGSIDPEQHRWLKERLRGKRESIYLLFFHHRLKDMSYALSDARENLLADLGDGALVVFTGHTHQHHLYWHAGQNGKGFYELNTGSVLEFPQIGRLIELRGNPGGRVWLISRALWSNLMTAREREMPAKDEIKRKLKECKDKREAKQENLADAVACGHYGAYDDYLQKRDGAKPPQPFDEMWEEANVIIKLTGSGPPGLEFCFP